LIWFVGGRVVEEREGVLFECEAVRAARVRGGRKRGLNTRV
jgi:hypothetical protein